MMFQKLRLLLPVMLVAALLVAGCGRKKRQAEPAGATKFEQGMTGKDTVAVKQLVDRFFGYAMNKQYAEAAGMLYRNDGNPDEEPQQLDNEEMAEVRSMLEAVPMVGYRIEYIKFSEYYVNEVLCHVIIRKAEGDMPEVTTKMFFKPVSYLGNWLLCLTNTEYGDRGLVKPGERDSMERAYRRSEATDSVKTTSE